MLTFVHPFLWGLWLVGIPVLIHLINMFRHKPVHWAAMEFLLASQKKYRTWVILKQLLLLMMRMAAIALVVLALAQPLLPEKWGGFIGARPAHHIVLLDDSYSMSDRRGESTAFDRAKAAIGRLGQAMLRPREPQSFTLLRLSRCGQYGGGTRPDFQKEPVDSQFPERLATTLKSIDVTQTAAEPLPAYEAIQQLLGSDTGERRVIYLFSDFRTRQWDKPEDLKKRLLQLVDNHAEIRLVDCVEDSGHSNLAITSLEPEEGIRAAGIQWRMKVTVQNYGSAAAHKVPIFWTADGKAGPQAAIDEIPPGASAEKLFYLSFPTAGRHQIAAHLDADAVSADNHRYAVVDVPLETPVLLIDGATSRRPSNSIFLQAALAAPGPVASGIDARRIESPRYLSLPTRPLDDFAMISVANVDRIDQSGIDALEKYVRDGGGVFFVTGSLTGGEFVNRSLYRGGKGVFPVPLSAPQPLATSPLDNTPDVQSEDHSVFRNIGNRAGYISKIHIEKYFATAAGWNAADDKSVRVIMRLRNGAPLLVEKSFGRGRVLALLTTTSTAWSNWAIGDAQSAYVAFVRNVVPYLSHRSAADAGLQVGEPKTVTFPAATYLPTVHFDGPGGDSSAANVEASLEGKDHLLATYPRTMTSGFYTARLTTKANKMEVRPFAVNVDPAEGDLKALTGPDLEARLSPALKYQFEYATNFETTLDESPGRNLGDWLLIALVVLLLLELMLAWSCGYHLSARAAPAARAPAYGSANGARSTGFSRNAVLEPPKGETTSAGGVA